MIYILEYGLKGDPGNWHRVDFLFRDKAAMELKKEKLLSDDPDYIKRADIAYIRVEEWDEEEFNKKAQHYGVIWPAGAAESWKLVRGSCLT